MIDPLLLDLPTSITTERLLLRTPQAGDGPQLLPALLESLPQLRRFLASLPWVAGEQTDESAERWCRNAQANFLGRKDLPFLIFERDGGDAAGRLRPAPHGVGDAEDGSGLLDPQQPRRPGLRHRGGRRPVRLRLRAPARRCGSNWSWTRTTPPRAAWRTAAASRWKARCATSAARRTARCAPPACMRACPRPLAMTTPQLRIARPVSDLRRAERMYAEGLGLRRLGGFEDHQGVAGVMLGLPGAGYHFEFTACRDHPVAPAPTAEDLAVFYLPDTAEWERRCAAMLASGFRAVPSFNPYWDACGRTFEDADGYRVVLQNAGWPA